MRDQFIKKLEQKISDYKKIEGTPSPDKDFIRTIKESRIKTEIHLELIKQQTEK